MPDFLGRRPVEPQEIMDPVANLRPGIRPKGLRIDPAVDAKMLDSADLM